MTTKELNCIAKLIDKELYLDFKEFLIDNKLASEDDFKDLTRDFEKASFICATLTQAALEEKLILLDYEWVLLPKEYIKVTCITETERKEFAHGI
jgi:hypothetical protein